MRRTFPRSVVCFASFFACCLVAAWLGVLLFNCFCSTVSTTQRVPSGPSSLNAIGNYDEGNCCTAVPYASEIIAATQNPICRRCTGGASCSNALCCSLGVRFYCRAAALIRAGSPGTHNGIATREQAHEANSGGDKLTAGGTATIISKIATKSCE